MDRIIVYPGAIPLDTDMLNTNRNTLVALHALIAATLGTTTAVDGLAVSASVPATMSVQVGPGSITQYGVSDATAYGSLPADLATPLMKMGVLLAPVTLALTAPATAGTQIAYLVEASFSETDQTPVVLPYYNAANPAMPYLGPANSGASQATVRQQRVSVQLRAGAAAPAGTATLPPVDAGWTALAAVLVSAGDTQVNAGAVFAAQTTRATPWKLPDLTPGFAFSQAFTTSGTFTVPNTITRLRVSVVGGGGAAASGGPSGGGGAGGRGKLWLSGVQPGSLIAVTVGANGAPVVGGAGTPGGSSSFGAYCSATGGQGSSGPTGAAGGTVSGAGVYYVGASGSDAVPGAARGGDGAGPGGGKGGSGSANGANAVSWGGGGGGSPASGVNGGAGGGGLVVVEW